MVVVNEESKKFDIIYHEQQIPCLNKLAALSLSKLNKPDSTNAVA